MPCQSTMPFGLMYTFVGYRRYVVGALRVEVAVSHNPLAALAEVGECVTYLLQRSVVGLKLRRFYVYAFYVVD